MAKPIQIVYGSYAATEFVPGENRLFVLLDDGRIFENETSTNRWCQVRGPWLCEISGHIGGVRLHGATHETCVQCGQEIKQGAFDAPR